MDTDADAGRLVEACVRLLRELARLDDRIKGARYYLATAGANATLGTLALANLRVKRRSLMDRLKALQIEGREPTTCRHHATASRSARRG